MALVAIMQALLIVGVILLLYLIYGIVFRLYLSPLAGVPGPRLAAVTGAYEKYYDLIQKGRLPWKIEELHQLYGKGEDNLDRV